MIKRGLASALSRTTVNRGATLFDSNGFHHRRDSRYSFRDLDRQGLGLNISSHARKFHDPVKRVNGNASEALFVRERPLNSMFDVVIVL